MDAGLKAVGDYIVDLAVTAFNDQFGFNFNPRDFFILSLPDNVMGKCAYEISNPDAYDDVKLHLYCTLTDNVVVYPYRLKDNQDFPTGPASKVYVAMAELNEEVLALNNNYIRRECPVFVLEPSTLNTFLLERDSQPILDEMYEYFQYEDGTPVVT